MDTAAGGPIAIDVFGAVEAEAVAEQISAIYQRASFAQLRRRRGFRLALAREDDGLVGFAYGAFLLSDTSWWDGMLAPLPAEGAGRPGRPAALAILGGETPSKHFDATLYRSGIEQKRHRPPV